jgi:hypothetical protein
MRTRIPAVLVLAVLASLSACKRLAAVAKKESGGSSSQPAAAAPPTVRIGDLTALGDGTHFNLGLMEETAGEEGRGGSGSESTAETTRNLYFYDAATRHGHWLLPNDHTIIADEYLLKPESDDPAHPPHKPRWEILLLISRDTDGDGTVTAEDRGVLALTNTAGDGVTDLVRDVVSLDSAPLLIDDGQALARVVLPAGVSLVQIDLEKRSVESVQAIPGRK